MKSAKNLEGVVNQKVSSMELNQKIRSPQQTERNHETPKDDYSSVINYSKFSKMVIKDMLTVETKKRLSTGEILAKYQEWFVSF